MRHTLPSTRPGPHLCAGSSSPETRCVPARPGGRSGLWPERRRPRSRRTLSASGRTPSAASQARHRAWKLPPAPANAASRWRLSLPRCNAFVFSSRALSVILTEERVLHFQPRRHTGTLFSPSPWRSRSAPALRTGDESSSMGLSASCRSRSEEHSSELQSPCNLVCRLLLEKNKKKSKHIPKAHVFTTTSLHDVIGVETRCTKLYRVVLTFLRPLMSDLVFFSFFFFNDTATTEIYTLSLHDALPISLECLFYDAVSGRRRNPARSVY